MPRTVKGVFYAYPTSDRAREFGRYKTGCYGVWTREGRELSRVVAAPFDTIAEAESAADMLVLPWCPVYQRHPLDGSRFFKPMPTDLVQPSAIMSTGLLFDAAQAPPSAPPVA